MAEYTKEESLRKIGLLIESQRSVLNLSIKQVANASGVSETLISQLENNKRDNIPKIGTLNAIAKAVGLPESDFHRVAGYAPLNEYEAKGVEEERKEKEWTKALKLLLLQAGFNEHNAEHVVITAQSMKFAQDFEKGKK
ncbi:MAG: helix-turn-helix transcriptional regulator [Candidatus Gastranaerophilales bacterium]|nr:helix-turn-helix transcriptional regulator [Candidatus Gastranaerophilales bacterium]